MTIKITMQPLCQGRCSCLPSPGLRLEDIRAQVVLSQVLLRSASLDHALVVLLSLLRGLVEGLLASDLYKVYRPWESCARLLQLVSRLIRMLMAKGWSRLAELWSHPVCLSFLVFYCFLITWGHSRMCGEGGLVFSGATGVCSLG